MEIMNTENTGELHTSRKYHDSLLSISCNWQISNNKQFVDAVTITAMQYSSSRINCEDVASVDTCIALQPIGSNTEPCMLNIKVSNYQRIARVAIISEGNVLEIFKQLGEYETTIHAEFIDEYEDNIVFLGETMIHPPTTEVSVKFIRTKNKGPLMWIYGIRLFLTDSTKEAKSSAFNYDIIQTFLSNASNGKMSQESEMAKRIFDDKQESMRKYREKLLETFASGSKYDEYINKIGRSDNKKRLSNCGDNYEQLNATECKNIIERRNSKTEYSNCEENYERSNADVNNDNKTESIKETKSGIVNDKDFIQTFLSNTFLGKMSQPDLTRMFEFYDNHDNNEILNNEQFNQKMLETLPSDSEYFEWKNKIAKKDTGKERRNCEANHEQLDSFKCKNKNVRRNSDKDCTSQEDKKSETDIRIYIDNKFHDMEKRLMERIDEMEASTNRKLNAILERLESRVNVQ